MFEPLRVALVAEGDTDRIVLLSALRNLLEGRDFILTLLQPEAAATFSPSPTGMGWPGVYRWFRQASQQVGGRLRDNPLFRFHDVLVAQIDADVAELSYQSGHIEETRQDLPCDKPCPPPSATTDALRSVLLGWTGEATLPPRVVFCTPSRNLEAWVLAALYPNDKVVKGGDLECRNRPEAILAGKKASERLVRRKGTGYDKRIDRYQQRERELQASWPRVRKVCTEAERFSIDFAAALP